MKIKFIVILLLIMIFTANVLAKINSKSDSVKYYVWIPSAIGGLNISQVALSNWAKGGDNSLAWTLMGNLSLSYINDDWTLRNNLKFAFGRTKLGGQDFRTNDNELYLESVLSSHLGWAVDPYFSNTINTAITKGFNFKKILRKKSPIFLTPAILHKVLDLRMINCLDLKHGLDLRFKKLLQINTGNTLIMRRQKKNWKPLNLKPESNQLLPANFIFKII